jgi:Zn-dependent protease
MALTALAGPVSNVLFSLIVVIIIKLMLAFGDMTNELMIYSHLALDSIAWISLYLAVFNLIPVPPLDGSKILYFFLSDRAANWFDRNSRLFYMGMLAMLFLIPLQHNPIFSWIRLLSSIIMMGLEWATIFIYNPFTA